MKPPPVAKTTKQSKVDVAYLQDRVKTRVFRNRNQGRPKLSLTVYVAKASIDKLGDVTKTGKGLALGSLQFDGSFWAPLKHGSVKPVHRRDKTRLKIDKTVYGFADYEQAVLDRCEQYYRNKFPVIFTTELRKIINSD